MRYRRLPEVANLRLELRAGRLAQEDLDAAAHQPVRETVPELPIAGYSALSLALTNLLGNAIKFSPPGATVW
jgi:signal transduction histidine kinase